MNTPNNKKSADRMPVAAGRFYSANKETLTNDLFNLFSTCIKAPSGQNVRAIISPHAGYIFSGKVAASSLTAIPKNAGFRNIFLIGSSHIIAFEGASVYNTGDFITPFGKIKVNKEVGDSLRNESQHFNFPVDAHLKEHSIEVQIPLIQYYFENEMNIVPIIIGTNNKNTIKDIAAQLKPYFTPENLFIISSDFSHYPSYKDAHETDNLTAEAIISNNSENLLNTLRLNSSKRISGLATSMCGWTSGLVLLYLSEGDPGLIFKKVCYCNSGDSQYGNKDEVVGYHAIILVEKDKKETASTKDAGEMMFSIEDTQKLLSIARKSISSMLHDKRKQIIDTDTLSPLLKEKMGAFVTLKIDGNLRGCIGRFISSDPLYKVVDQMALSSAFEDSRFSPITKEELEKTEIEISVLGPQKRISNIEEIKIGKHGIYIKKDFRSGTMLPQVATENGWTVEQFLGYTARDKAGIGWTGWKDAEIYIYEAVVLKEKVK